VRFTARHLLTGDLFAKLAIVAKGNARRMSNMSPRRSQQWGELLQRRDVVGNPDAAAVS
jgi:hypothetical protein